MRSEDFGTHLVEEEPNEQERNEAEGRSGEAGEEVGEGFEEGDPSEDGVRVLHSRRNEHSYHDGSDLKRKEQRVGDEARQKETRPGKTSSWSEDTANSDQTDHEGQIPANRP